MQMPQAGRGVQAVDRCASERAAVDAACAEAKRVQSGYNALVEHGRELRRRLVAAERELAEAVEAARPELRAEEKAAARDRYESTRARASDDDELAEATAEWARALDAINRRGRDSKRAVTKHEAAAARLRDENRESERAEQAARIAAEAAEAACLDARVRLAACEEQPEVPVPAGATASVFAPRAATGGHAPAVKEREHGEPLVIEALLLGDRLTLDQTCARIAEGTGMQRSQVILLLQELVDGIVLAASREGFLTFEDGHPFWSHLNVEEARDVVAALARLGFQFEPTEGWHAGRAPTTMDLSMALAYAGLDARSMRDLPTADELRELPASISVDALGFLAVAAPDLAVDHVVGLFERRAEPLSALWDHWGYVRPVLLSDRSILGEVVV